MSYMCPSWEALLSQTAEIAYGGVTNRTFSPSRRVDGEGGRALWSGFLDTEECLAADRQRTQAMQAWLELGETGGGGLWVLLLLCFVVIVIAVVTLWCYKADQQPLRFRTLPATLLFTLNALLLVTVAVQSLVLDADQSCTALYLALQVLLPVHLLFYLVRALQLAFVYQWTEAKFRFSDDTNTRFIDYKWILTAQSYLVVIATGCVLFAGVVATIWTQSALFDDVFHHARAIPGGLPHTTDVFVSDSLYTTARCKWLEVPKNVAQRPDGALDTCSCLDWGLLGTNGTRAARNACDSALYDVCVALPNNTASASVSGRNTQLDRWGFDSVQTAADFCHRCAALPNAFGDGDDDDAALPAAGDVKLQLSPRCRHELRRYYASSGQCGYHSVVPDYDSCSTCFFADKTALSVWACSIVLLCLLSWVTFYMYRSMRDKLLLHTELLISFITNQIGCAVLLIVLGMASARHALVDADWFPDAYAAVPVVAATAIAFVALTGFGVSVVYPLIVCYYWQYSTGWRQVVGEAADHNKKAVGAADRNPGLAAQGGASTPNVNATGHRKSGGGRHFDDDLEEPASPLSPLSPGSPVWPRRVSQGPSIARTKSGILRQAAYTHVQSLFDGDVEEEQELAFCLHNRHALNMYMKFSVQEFTVENIMFLTTITKLRSDAERLTALELAPRLRDVYEKFIQDGSSWEINMPSNIKNDLETLFAKAMGEKTRREKVLKAQERKRKREERKQKREQARRERAKRKAEQSGSRPRSGGGGAAKRGSIMDAIGSTLFNKSTTVSGEHTNPNTPSGRFKFSARSAGNSAGQNLSTSRAARSGAASANSGAKKSPQSPRRNRIGDRFRRGFGLGGGDGDNGGNGEGNCVVAGDGDGGEHHNGRGSRSMNKTDGTIDGGEERSIENPAYVRNQRGHRRQQTDEPEVGAGHKRRSSSSIESATEGDGDSAAQRKPRTNSGGASDVSLATAARTVRAEMERPAQPSNTRETPYVIGAVESRIVNSKTVAAEAKEDEEQGGNGGAASRGSVKRRTNLRMDSLHKRNESKLSTVSGKSGASNSGQADETQQPEADEENQSAEQGQHEEADRAAGTGRNDARQRGRGSGSGSGSGVGTGVGTGSGSRHRSGSGSAAGSHQRGPSDLTKRQMAEQQLHKNRMNRCLQEDDVYSVLSDELNSDVSEATETSEIRRKSMRNKMKSVFGEKQEEFAKAAPLPRDPGELLDWFKPAVQEVTKLIVRDSWPRFRQTPAYAGFRRAYERDKDIGQRLDHLLSDDMIGSPRLSVRAGSSRPVQPSEAIGGSDATGLKNKPFWRRKRPSSADPDRSGAVFSSGEQSRDRRHSGPAMGDMPGNGSEKDKRPSVVRRHSLPQRGPDGNVKHIGELKTAGDSHIGEITSPTFGKPAADPKATAALANLQARVGSPDMRSNETHSRVDSVVPAVRRRSTESQGSNSDSMLGSPLSPGALGMNDIPPPPPPPSGLGETPLGSPAVPYRKAGQLELYTDSAPNSPYLSSPSKLFDVSSQFGVSKQVLRAPSANKDKPSAGQAAALASAPRTHGRRSIRERAQQPTGLDAYVASGMDDGRRGSTNSVMSSGGRGGGPAAGGGLFASYKFNMSSSIGSSTDPAASSPLASVRKQAMESGGSDTSGSPGTSFRARAANNLNRMASVTRRGSAGKPRSGKRGSGGDGFSSMPAPRGDLGEFGAAHQRADAVPMSSRSIMLQQKLSGVDGSPPGAPQVLSSTAPNQFHTVPENDVPAMVGSLPPPAPMGPPDAPNAVIPAAQPPGFHFVSPPQMGPPSMGADLAVSAARSVSAAASFPSAGSDSLSASARMTPSSAESPFNLSRHGSKMLQGDVVDDDYQQIPPPPPTPPPPLLPHEEAQQARRARSAVTARQVNRPVCRHDRTQPNHGVGGASATMHITPSTTTATTEQSFFATRVPSASRTLQTPTRAAGDANANVGMPDNGHGMKSVRARSSVQQQSGHSPPAGFHYSAASLANSTPQPPRSRFTVKPHAMPSFVHEPTLRMSPASPVKMSSPAALMNGSAGGRDGVGSGSPVRRTPKLSPREERQAPDALPEHRQQPLDATPGTGMAGSGKWMAPLSPLKTRAHRGELSPRGSAGQKHASPLSLDVGVANAAGGATAAISSSYNGKVTGSTSASADKHASFDTGRSSPNSSPRTPSTPASVRSPAPIEPPKIRNIMIKSRVRGEATDLVANTMGMTAEQIVEFNRWTGNVGHLSSKSRHLIHENHGRAAAAMLLGRDHAQGINMSHANKPRIWLERSASEAGQLGERQGLRRGRSSIISLGRHSKAPSQHHRKPSGTRHRNENLGLLGRLGGLLRGRSPAREGEPRNARLAVPPDAKPRPHNHPRHDEGSRQRNLEESVIGGQSIHQRHPGSGGDVCSGPASLGSVSMETDTAAEAADGNARGEASSSNVEPEQDPARASLESAGSTQLEDVVRLSIHGVEMTAFSYGDGSAAATSGSDADQGAPGDRMSLGSVSSNRSSCSVKRTLPFAVATSQKIPGSHNRSSNRSPSANTALVNERRRQQQQEPEPEQMQQRQQHGRDELTGNNNNSSSSSRSSGGGGERNSSASATAAGTESADSDGQPPRLHAAIDVDIGEAETPARQHLSPATGHGDRGAPPTTGRSAERSILKWLDNDSSDDDAEGGKDADRGAGGSRTPREEATRRDGLESAGSFDERSGGAARNVNAGSDKEQQLPLDSASNEDAAAAAAEAAHKNLVLAALERPCSATSDVGDEEAQQDVPVGNENSVRHSTPQPTAPTTDGTVSGTPTRPAAGPSEDASSPLPEVGSPEYDAMQGIVFETNPAVERQNRKKRMAEERKKKGYSLNRKLQPPVSMLDESPRKPQAGDRAPAGGSDARSLQDDDVDFESNPLFERMQRKEQQEQRRMQRSYSRNRRLQPVPTSVLESPRTASTTRSQSQSRAPPPASLDQMMQEVEFEENPIYGRPADERNGDGVGPGRQRRKPLPIDAALEIAPSSPSSSEAVPEHRNCGSIGAGREGGGPSHKHSFSGWSMDSDLMSSDASETGAAKASGSDADAVTGDDPTEVGEAQSPSVSASDLIHAWGHRRVPSRSQRSVKSVHSVASGGTHAGNGGAFHREDSPVKEHMWTGGGSAEGGGNGGSEDEVVRHKPEQCIVSQSRTGTAGRGGGSNGRRQQPHIHHAVARAAMRNPQMAGRGGRRRVRTPPMSPSLLPGGILAAIGGRNGGSGVGVDSDSGSDSSGAARLHPHRRLPAPSRRGRGGPNRQLKSRRQIELQEQKAQQQRRGLAAPPPTTQRQVLAPDSSFRVLLDEQSVSHNDNDNEAGRQT